MPPDRKLHSRDIVEVSKERFTAGSFTRQRVTWATYGLVGYFAYLETVLGPLMPFLRAELDLSYTAASLHFAAFPLGGVLIGLFGDRVEIRWGRGGALWAGALGMAAGAILLAVMPTAPGTITAILIMGFFGSLLLITTQAILADRHGTDSLVAITESNVAASACAILASLAVGFFAAAGLGWRSALMVPVAGVAFLAARFRRESLEATGHREPAHTLGTGLPPAFWIYWGVLTLGVAVEWCIAYWGADFLENATGMGRSTAAAALTVYFGAMLVGRIGASRMARSLPGPALLAGSLGVGAAGFPLLWLSPTVAGALAGLSLVGLGIGCVYPLAISVAVASAPGCVETATARLALGASGAILAAPFLLGTLADFAGIAGAFGVVLPLVLAAFALTLWGHRVARVRATTAPPGRLDR